MLVDRAPEFLDLNPPARRFIWLYFPNQCNAFPERYSAADLASLLLHSYFLIQIPTTTLLLSSWCRLDNGK